MVGLGGHLGREALGDVELGPDGLEPLGELGAVLVDPHDLLGHGGQPTRGARPGTGTRPAGSRRLRCGHAPPQELAVANRHDAAVPALEAFLTAQGRRKFVRPLFNALAADAEWGRPIARRLYPGVRPLYHPVTASAVDALDVGVGDRP